jgi:hypothetical protein
MKKKIDSNIHSIFSTSIYVSGLGRKLIGKESKFIQKTKQDTYKNKGNTTSNDTYILNNKNFNTFSIDTLGLENDLTELNIPKLIDENN